MTPFEDLASGTIEDAAYKLAAVAAIASSRKQADVGGLVDNVVQGVKNLDPRYTAGVGAAGLGALSLGRELVRHPKDRRYDNVAYAAGLGGLLGAAPSMLGAAANVASTSNVPAPPAPTGLAAAAEQIPGVSSVGGYTALGAAGSAGMAAAPAINRMRGRDVSGLEAGLRDIRGGKVTPPSYATPSAPGGSSPFLDDVNRAMTGAEMTTPMGAARNKSLAMRYGLPPGGEFGAKKWIPTDFLRQRFGFSGPGASAVASPTQLREIARLGRPAARGAGVVGAVAPLLLGLGAQQLFGNR
jgi:hypothetical protein